jgi:hypothetical protein
VLLVWRWGSGQRTAAPSGAADPVPVAVFRKGSVGG